MLSSWCFSSPNLWFIAMIRTHVNSLLLGTLTTICNFFLQVLVEVQICNASESNVATAQPWFTVLHVLCNERTYTDQTQHGKHLRCFRYGWKRQKSRRKYIYYTFITSWKRFTFRASMIALKWLYYTLYYYITHDVTLVFPYQITTCWWYFFLNVYCLLSKHNLAQP